MWVKWTRWQTGQLVSRTSCTVWTSNIPFHTLSLNTPNTGMQLQSRKTWQHWTAVVSTRMCSIDPNCLQTRSYMSCNIYQSPVECVCGLLATQRVDWCIYLTAFVWCQCSETKIEKWATLVDKLLCIGHGPQTVFDVRCQQSFRFRWCKESICFSHNPNRPATNLLWPKNRIYDEFPSTFDTETIARTWA